jgi:hypothetical protein
LFGQLRTKNNAIAQKISEFTIKFNFKPSKQPFLGIYPTK